MARARYQDFRCLLVLILRSTLTVPELSSLSVRVPSGRLLESRMASDNWAHIASLERARTSGGTSVDQARRLRDLERENGRLEKRAPERSPLERVLRR